MIFTSCNAEIPITQEPFNNPNIIAFHVKYKMVESCFTSVGYCLSDPPIYVDTNILELRKSLKDVLGIVEVEILPYRIRIEKAKAYEWCDITDTVYKTMRSALSDNESHTTISYEQRCPWCGCTGYTDYYVKAEPKIVNNYYYDNEYEYSFSRCSACGKNYTCKVTTDHNTYYTTERIK